MEKGTATCLKCEFSMEVATKRFPFPAPALATVMDPASKLTAAEVATLESQVGKLRKRLPQVHFINCIVPLGAGVDLREFGFWLLNNGQFGEDPEAKSFALLFLIDPQGKALSVTVGYGLEPMVMDTEWEVICRSCKDLFYREKYCEGIELFLREAADQLAVAAIQIRKERRKR